METKLTKTITFGLGKIMGFDKKKGRLISLEDEHRKMAYEEILKSFHDFANLCNFTTSLLYTSRILEVDLKTIGFNTGYKPILKKLKLETHLNGKALNQAFNIAKAHFSGKNWKKLMARGEAVLPTHKADGTHPIYFHREAVNLFKEENKFFILYNIFADKWANENKLPSWLAFEIKIKKRDKSGVSQIEKILAETWEKGSGQLVRRKASSGLKYIMHLSVKYAPDPYEPLQTENVLGIDLGINSPAAIHIRKNGEPQKWAMLIGDGRMLLQARNIVKREIVKLLRGIKRKDSPIIGRDREILLVRLRDLRKKERRIIKTASQRLAAKIAEIAKRHGAGIWQMEELGSSIKEDKPWLARNWAPGVLVDAIRWQAKQNDAKLLFVNPRKTSQRCSECGYISRDNRPKNEKKAAYFKCVNCSYEDHADKNAARNLSILGIDKTIDNALKAE